MILKKGIVTVITMSMMAGTLAITSQAAELNTVQEISADATVIISKTKATSIALKNAKLSSSKVSYIKREKEKDDGRWEWEIDFYEKATKNKYEYNIDAKTGKILSYKKQVNKKNIPATGSKLTKAKAKKLVLTNAGLTGKTVRGYEIEADRQYGRRVYDVEFVYKGVEYSYTIDYLTSTIIEIEIDYEG